MNKPIRFLLMLVAMAAIAFTASATGLVDPHAYLTPDAQLGLAAAGAFGITTYKQAGDCLDLTPTAAVSRGVGFLFGTSLFGVAVNDVAANVEGVFKTEGVVSIGKTAALAIAVGDRVFWDPVGKVVNKTVAAQQCVGICTVAAAGADANVTIKLGCYTPVGT